MTAYLNKLQSRHELGMRLLNSEEIDSVTGGWGGHQVIKVIMAIPEAIAAMVAREGR